MLLFIVFARWWTNIVLPTNLSTRVRKCYMNIGPMLDQRCLTNANGPTISQRWTNVVMQSGDHLVYFKIRVIRRRKYVTNIRNRQHVRKMFLSYHLNTNKKGSTTDLDRLLITKLIVTFNRRHKGKGFLSWSIIVN